MHTHTRAWRNRVCIYKKTENACLKSSCKNKQRGTANAPRNRVYICFCFFLFVCFGKRFFCKQSNKQKNKQTNKQKINAKQNKSKQRQRDRIKVNIPSSSALAVGFSGGGGVSSSSSIRLGLGSPLCLRCFCLLFVISNHSFILFSFQVNKKEKR